MDPFKPNNSFNVLRIDSIAAGSKKADLEVNRPIKASTGLEGISLGMKKTVVMPIKMTSTNVITLESKNL
jgi:hypothetical protein